MRITASTDGKYLGESVEIIDDKVTFSSGEVMNVEKTKIIDGKGFIYSSNYIIFVEEN